MPKKTKYPKLRSRTRKGKAGQVWVSWWYDMRAEGKSDISLGTDYDAAVERWKRITEGAVSDKGTVKEAMDDWEANVLPTYTVKDTRRSYARQLKRLRPVFESSTWAEIDIGHLVEYLERRTAKTQGNREMAVFSIIWNHARKKRMTKLPYPAAGMEKSRWKNPEKPRRSEVTDAIFEAIYYEADQTLKDAMDLATATGMRVTDCTEVLLPKDNVLRLDASKTGKEAEFEVNLSQVLPQLVERRRAVKADHLMLLSTPRGKRVSPDMLGDRFEKARKRAWVKPEHEAISEAIKAVILRDMRKRAADLAGDAEEASKLLQHASVEFTKIHYRTREKLKPTR